jgi:hypothetical protein
MGSSIVDPPHTSRWPVERHWPDDYTPQEQVLLLARLRLRPRRDRRTRAQVMDLGPLQLVWEVHDET